jgi:hypothetical protein
MIFGKKSSVLEGELYSRLATEMNDRLRDVLNTAERFKKITGIVPDLSKKMDALAEEIKQLDHDVILPVLEAFSEAYELHADLSEKVAEFTETTASLIDERSEHVSEIADELTSYLNG